MLVMSDKQQPKHVLTNIDSYIPFSIEFSNSGLADLYWRCGNGKTCLFELGLSNTGEVINITLASINSSNILKNNNKYKIPFPVENFLPKFDVSEWNIISEDYSSIFRDDFNYELQLIVGLDYLVLNFLNIEKSVCYFKNEELYLGFNSNKELSSIQLTHIAAEEIEIIKEIFKVDTN
ncbi:acetyltransferase [Acinetobacter nosocomialis]|uniref:acetyltransferase n=2 Tax=Acinetobacter TaxID=469 RepID=UPI0012C205F6|nr:acetyltransferase [Acinetobacter nosocomialis]MPS61118.1 acetyltransferase [Acinetobacter sp.]MBO8215178.1 acetyltransferase [Acinetobacter nosocomialis]MBR7715721.1 acetyltransferase [Acinetobacter nosocomialis]MDO7217818.1 acetyltransferase [Acinetobacter nosocomialis]MDX7878725.1 acetyltransferase [Acinetobacter nosocomialis]